MIIPPLSSAGGFHNIVILRLPADDLRFVISLGGDIDVPLEGNGASNGVILKLDVYLADPIPLVILISSKYPLKVSLEPYAPIVTALDEPRLPAAAPPETDKDSVPLV